MRRLACVVIVFLCSCVPGFAQTGNANLSGRVTDQSKGLIVGARVVVTNVDTNVARETKTNGDGYYSVGSLLPGPYKVEIDKTGFENIVKPDLILHTQDVLEINFELRIGSSSQTITVTDSAAEINTSPAVSMTVTREFVENMPLNGRSFQDLIQLAPGTVAASSFGANTGYYSVNGQRTVSNNYSVDGVSANLGGTINRGAESIPGAGLAGAVPAQTALGTTQNLASVDSLQEFKIQTSGYTAEYGRNPGGQVQLTTRSGTNDVHGTGFDYFRNTALDANNYYNNYYGLPQTAEHQNDFGGTIGGPLVIPKVYDGKDKTFFFFSYEGLRLLLPDFEEEYVPTQALRQWASQGVQPFLNATPLPNGPINNDGCFIPGTITPCDALFTYGFSDPNNLDNVSIRIDQSFGTRLRGFLRYADTSSSSRSGAEQFAINGINTHSWTAGVTITISNSLLDDLRFNYSHDGEESFTGQRSIGGSVPLDKNLLVPLGYESSYDQAYATVSLPGTSLYVSNRYGGTGSVQHQYQIVDGFNWTQGSHSLKFGGDWRRLTPEWVSTPYVSNAMFKSLTDIQQGNATTLYTGAVAPGSPIFDNLSLYAQDHWKIASTLSVDYGLRWEFNPPPSPSNGHYPVAISSADLTVAQLAQGSQPYRTNYHSFAPRFGFAWNAIRSPSHALTVRGGFGIFFDTAQQVVGSSYAAAYPFRVTGPTQTGIALPFSDSALAPPPLNFPLVPPYPYLAAVSSPSLTSPYAEQWNVSVDEALSAKNTLTVSYVGNIGRKLLFTQYYDQVPGNPSFTSLNFTSNGSLSNYNALQLQDTGRIASGLDVVGSFTWAHALDNASTVFSQSAPIYGNSDLDLRCMLNLGLNYQPPSVGSGLLRSLTGGWTLGNRFTAETGYPLSITEAYVTLPDGSQAQYSPDLIPSVPIYLTGSAADVNGQPVPGNWRLNSPAFAFVPTDPNTGIPIRQGTLGRNFIHGPGFWTLNTSVQRSFPIYERLRLIFRLDAFNVFNHPNLNAIDNGLFDSTFGQSNGSAGTIGSSNPLYAMGAARSLQLSLKLQF